ncbi:hypothetical protein LY90DRAFT_501874 [Neocallimastix californiae]|uniref:BZIP domain-containing protein n=1 Tax=Neocallimastix californiae TaxID=1754190 RepID=A0A1Y2EX46_9FUNG|nr:hypothetical protein LY90DRAFT_501874 [Neocallimastix californiae]|eukprot:ORY76159.1 hypothetical protein LY90DRAFT_501874 [Neocallimastix californiae]
MSQFNPLLRNTQTNFFEFSSSSLDNPMYPSPDKYRHNTVNMILKSIDTKQLQNNNLNSLNHLKYNSKIYNNLKFWNKLHPTENPIPHGGLNQNYFPQVAATMNLQQKSIMAYGNVTPISPNHDKLISNGAGLINNLPVNTELMNGPNFISDINSPTFKESIDLIQQQSEFINDIDPSILSIPSSISFTDIKETNEKKLNLLTNSHSAELIAASTLLGPKSNPDTAPLLTDVVVIPSSENYAANQHHQHYPAAIRQENLMTPMANGGTPLPSAEINSFTTYSQDYSKIANSFYSPVLSPPINQVYSQDLITSQSKSLTTPPTKKLKYEKLNYIERNTHPVIKTTMNKKITKRSNSTTVLSNKNKNMISINPHYIKINLLKKENKALRTPIDLEDKMKKENDVLKTPMDLDVKIKGNEKSFSEKKLNLQNVPKDNIDYNNNMSVEVSSQNNKNTINSHDTLSEKEDHLLEKNPLPSPISASVSDIDNFSFMQSLIEIEDKNENKIVNEIENEKVKEKEKEKEKKTNDVMKTVKNEEITESINLKEFEATPLNLDKTPEKEENFEIKKSEGREHDVPKNEIEVDKKEIESVSLKEKKEGKLKDSLTREEKKKKNKKDKTNNDKKDSITKSKDTSDPLAIKKVPRFSMKKAKNDPVAIEQHIILKRKRNTEAARRSRQRKVQQMKNLEEAVARLTKELEEANNEIKSTKAKYEKVLEESKISKKAYEDKIKVLEEQLKQHPFELRR